MARVHVLVSVAVLVLVPLRTSTSTATATATDWDSDGTRDRDATTSAAAAVLRDFGYLNSGVVHAGQQLRTYPQCTRADVEGRHGFKTGEDWEYLYTGDGQPPPLGLRSAVPLGGQHARTPCLCAIAFPAV